MIPEKTIKDLLKKHTTLEKDLSTGDIDKKNWLVISGKNDPLS